MSKENSSPGTHRFPVLPPGLWTWWWQAHSPGRAAYPAFSAEEAAEHSKTEVPGQALELLPQLWLLLTAWWESPSRGPVYLSKQPEESTVKEK